MELWIVNSSNLIKKKLWSHIGVCFELFFIFFNDSDTCHLSHQHWSVSLSTTPKVWTAQCFVPVKQFSINGKHVVFANLFDPARLFFSGENYSVVVKRAAIFTTLAFIVNSDVNPLKKPQSMTNMADCIWCWLEKSMLIVFPFCDLKHRFVPIVWCQRLGKRKKSVTNQSRCPMKTE